MSGTFDGNFEDFISTLYDKGTVPPVFPVKHDTDVGECIRLKDYVPVLLQDETEPCAEFGNWCTWYEFEGWLRYRQTTNPGREFVAMAQDIMLENAWCAEMSKWVDMLYVLSTLRRKYLHKFGHEPVNMHKFMRSFRRFGEETVLSADRY